MLSTPQNACFIIADISGFTKFLAQSEMDHAQDIISDLLENMVRSLKPFRLVEFEGDAAFVYALHETVDGSMLQDVVESAYFKFRRRLRDLKRASACECRACAGMGDLDFKFVVHHGEMVKHKTGGREGVAGPNVILVHRLLKNSVNEKFGRRAYALYSDACFAAMGIDPAEQGLVEHHESIDIIGDVKLWVRDLEATWQAENANTRMEVTRADAYMMLEYDIPAPPQVVWEYLTVPGQWQKWWPADGIIENSEKKRRGVGTNNHCMHGKNAIIEETLDWRPFDYYTLTVLLPVPGAPKITMTRAFVPAPDGTTHLEFRVAMPKPKDKEFVDQAGANFAAKMAVAMEKLRGMLRETTAVE